MYKTPTLAELNAPSKILITVNHSNGRAWSEATLRRVGERTPFEGVKLTDVYTTPSLRGRGWGRQVIQSALAVAQRNRWPVFLYVKPYGYGKEKLDAWQLSTFYRSFGFAPVEPCEPLDTEVLLYTPWLCLSPDSRKAALNSLFEKVSKRQSLAKPAGRTERSGFPHATSSS